MEIVDIWQNLSLVKNSQVVDGDDGDLAKFGKKKHHNHAFPPPLYVGGK